MDPFLSAFLRRFNQGVGLESVGI